VGYKSKKERHSNSKNMAGVMDMFVKMLVNTMLEQENPTDIRKFWGKVRSKTNVHNSVAPDRSTTCPDEINVLKTASSLLLPAPNLSSLKRVIIKRE